MPARARFHFVALTAVALTFAASGPLYAQEAQEDRCASLGEAAAAVMEMRQSGVVMSAAMATVTDDNPSKSLLTSMILEAYGEPAYRTPDHQNRAVTDFRNKMEYICYSSR